VAQRTADASAAVDLPPRMSYEAFLAWVPDGKQAEWVDGEVIVLTTSDRHARLSRLFVNLLTPFLAMFNLGEVFDAPFLMRATPGGPGREPDILVLLTQHLDRIKRVQIEGPADFIVELLSPETTRTDRVRKRREYEAAGVPKYLIVDAREGRFGFEFYRLNERGRYEPVVPDAAGRYHSAILPGLWLDPRWFAQVPLPDADDLLFEIAPDAYDAWIDAKRRRHRS
jgi:Uma2 family endonuclease